MKITQISVFLENKAGRLAAITETLAAANINISALSIADTSDFGILRLIVDNPQKAYEVLKAAEFTVSLTEVIGVQMPDVPGGLASVMKAFGELKINIEYLYAFIGNEVEKALVVLKVEDIDVAITKLAASEIQLIEKQEIFGK
ncbi:MAG: ACT domain-containing protein [Clostridia bacterium]